VCSLRDSEKPIADLGAKTYGISLDDVATQKQFHTQQKLNFPLLSDPDGSAAKRFQTLVEGKGYAARVTFVIDPTGVVRHVDRNVQVATHGADVAAVLKQLQAAK
jgi:thioredoxin-dependent peroxiredoxin